MMREFIGEFDIHDVFPFQFPFKLFLGAVAGLARFANYDLSIAPRVHSVMILEAKMPSLSAKILQRVKGIHVKNVHMAPSRQ